MYFCIRKDYSSKRFLQSSGHSLFHFKGKNRFLNDVIRKRRNVFFAHENRNKSLSSSGIQKLIYSSSSVTASVILMQDKK